MGKHLAKCPRCGERLTYESSVGGRFVCPHCGTALTPPGSDEAAEEGEGLIGRTLGEFEILEQIGRGGMGAVYRARQASLERDVAVKVLPSAFSRDAAWVARFRREAKAAAAVRHPYIIDVHAVGEDRGFQYIAMELVDGYNLAHIVRNAGPISPDLAITLLRQVAAALAAAHACGVLHRDVKPSNILINAQGEAKVADFGLAKRPDSDVSVTADGTPLGTPLYLPPEVARGRRADPRSDLYSLGATFYHALAGKPPFEADSATELAIKHAEAHVPDLHELAPHIPMQLCLLVHRLLRKEPAQRPQTAQDVIGALDRIQPTGRRGTGRKRAGRRAARRAGPQAQTTLADRRRAKAQHQRKAIVVGGISAGALAVLAAVLAVALWPRGGRTPQGPGTHVVARPGTSAPPRKPRTERTARKRPATIQTPRIYVGPPWEADWKATETKVAALVAEERYGDAMAEYNRLVDRHHDMRLRERADSASMKVYERAITVCDETLSRAQKLAAGGKFDEARAALQRVIERYGVPLKAERAKMLLAHLKSQETGAAEVDKWKGLEARARKLAEAGRYDQAAELLASATTLRVEDIDRLVAKATAAVAKARRDALEAYAQHSDKVWARFHERDYPAARSLLKQAAAEPRFQPTAACLAADQEAAALLGAFWDAIGTTLAGMKGRFLAIGGTGGTVVRVQDGVVTVKAGTVEMQQPVLKLAAAQAIRLAGTQRGPREKLAIAVFLLAEGQKLDEAGKTLAAAGDGPALDWFRYRLWKDQHGPQEAAACLAWQAVRRCLRGQLTQARASRGDALLAAFRAEHGETAFARHIAAELAIARKRVDAVLWLTLFDGETLDGWRVVTEGPFTAHGEVRLEAGHIVLDKGAPVTGIAWTGVFPSTGYEIAWEATRLKGKGRFSSATFPVGDRACTLDVGAWSDSIVGLGKLDGKEANANATTRRMSFENGRWYALRLRVTAVRIEAWIDGKQVIECPLAEHTLAPMHAPAVPFGLVADNTTGAVRGIRLRRFGGAPPLPPPDAEGWMALFDGKSLDGWDATKASTFGQGEVAVDKGRILLPKGDASSAIVWKSGFPTLDYEVAIEAMVVEGGADFCDVAFPVGASRCALVVNGFDGGKVALTIVDGRDGRDNLTTKPMRFDSNKWYRVRLRVAQPRIQAWIDDKQIVDIPTAGHTFTPPGSIETLAPFAVFSWKTGAALRSIRLRRLFATPAPRVAATDTTGLAERRKLDAAYAAALAPAEARAAACDFRGAAAALAKVRFDHKELKRRLAARRQALERLAALKARMIALVNTRKPPFRKSAVLLPGTNADLVRADDKAITARLPDGRTEAHPWSGLGPASATRLAQLAIDRASPDDCLAAGLLALALGDVRGAERDLGLARQRGAQIAPFLDGLADALLQQAQAALRKKQAERAEALLTSIQKQFAGSPWLAWRGPEVEAALAEATRGAADREAERLYAQAADLFEQRELHKLKPILDKLRTDFPTSRAVNDPQRKPPFADMLAAVKELGKALTVAQEGEADFKSLAAAVEAATPNSLIEIADSRPYNEEIIIPANKPGLTVRGSSGCWPIVTSVGPKKDCRKLLQISAPRTTIEHLVITHGAPAPRTPTDNRREAIWAQTTDLRFRHVIVGVHRARAVEFGAHTQAEFHGCVFAERVYANGRNTFTHCYWVRSGLEVTGGDLTIVTDAVAPWISIKSPAELRHCTVAGKVTLASGPNVVRDCIIGSVASADPKLQVDYCNVFSKDGLQIKVKPGKRCFSADPQFRDPGRQNYHLRPGSPCCRRASDRHDLGCRYPDDMVAVLKKAFELRKKGVIDF